MSEAPTVFCPKEGKKVPVWYCIGSFVQGREMCPDLIEITVRLTGDSEVKCKPKREKQLKFLILDEVDPLLPKDLRMLTKYLTSKKVD